MVGPAEDSIGAVEAAQNRESSQVEDKSLFRNRIMGTTWAPTEPDS